MSKNLFDQCPPAQNGKTRICSGPKYLAKIKTHDDLAKYNDEIEVTAWDQNKIMVRMPIDRFENLITLFQRHPILGPSKDTKAFHFKPLAKDKARRIGWNQIRRATNSEDTNILCDVDDKKKVAFCVPTSIIDSEQVEEKMIWQDHELDIRKKPQLETLRVVEVSGNEICFVADEDFLMQQLVKL
jgi:hypothetical protein